MGERLLGLAADVLRSFGSAFGGRHLAIVGGAVPSLLVEAPPTGMEPHVGTADLDLHVSLHLLDGETADYYDAIIDGLTGLGLAPDQLEGGQVVRWRWIGMHRGARLQVELLCPVRSRGGVPERPAANTPAERNFGPIGQITALAVGFGYLVPLDTITVERVVETSRGMLRFEFPVADVTSWLCLKSDAIMRRDKPKDAYDVVWAIAGIGPRAAARRVSGSRLMASEFGDEVRLQLSRLIEQFVGDESVGARSYADFLATSNAAIDRRFAVGAVQEFGRFLAEEFNSAP